MIDAPCADCSKEGRQRMGVHTAGNGDSVCNTHFLQRMRVSAVASAEPLKFEGVDGDVLSALVNLGYDKVRAEKAVIATTGGAFEERLRNSLAALKNTVGSAAAFLSDPQAIERDHAARTGQPEQSVRRRQAQRAPVDHFVEHTLATSHLHDDDEEEEAEEKVTRGRRELDVDWVKVQNERSSGVSVTKLAAKYSVTPATVYAHTKPAAFQGNSAAAKAASHAASASAAETRRAAPSVPAAGCRRLVVKVTGGNYESVLADLREKRERLTVECTQVDAAIEALEGIA